MAVCARLQMTLSLSIGFMMQGLLLLTYSVAWLAGFGEVATFQETNKLLRAFDNLETQGTDSLVCIDQLEDPRKRVDEFVTDSVGIYDSLTTLTRRCGTINTLASTMLLIPGVNKIGAVVLIPLTTGLTWFGRAASITLTAAEPVVNAMRHWRQLIKTVSTNSQSTRLTLHEVVTAAINGKTHVSEVATLITMMVCGPARTGLVTNIESTATGMDTAPKTAEQELKRVDDICQEIKNFFTTTGSKINSEVTLTLSLSKTAIDTINKGFDPIQDYLDEVDKVLDTKLCLNDVERIINNEIAKRQDTVKDIAETVEKTAETVVDEVKDFLDRWGRRRRAAYKSAMKAIRQKRDVCVTVRQILDGSVAVDGGYTASAEFLIREVFNKVMPEIPKYTKELENLASTLLPFESDFDLASKTNHMVPVTTALNPFLAMDYEQTFWEKPAQTELTSSQQACSGEVTLIIP